MFGESLLILSNFGSSLDERIMRTFKSPYPGDRIADKNHPRLLSDKVVGAFMDI